MLQVSFQPFPVITTDRLVLRQMKHDDKDDMFIMRSDPEMMQYIPRPVAKTTDDIVALIDVINQGTTNNETINWVITLKGIDKVIGTIGFVRMKKEHYRGEIGYMLAKDQQKKGIMQEAIASVISYGFKTMKLHSIEAIVDPANTASARILEKNNFIKEGSLRENEFYNGRFLSSDIYSLLSPYPHQHEESK